MKTDVTIAGDWMNEAMAHLYRARAELEKGIKELDELWAVEPDEPTPVQQGKKRGKKHAH